ncbi:GL19034 [Drosophila persimilis]|uniref:GL19034 n=1 Tax=Drosophila persimilis TaxID=7234 RepID=B4G6V5_DROPE|nr:GL19034 [Drosophila persimilis]
MDYGGGGGSASGSGTNNAEASDLNMCGGQDMLEGKAKEKARRYWTPSEEERLYEIWGRDNWRLTRNGKNTIFFAQWAEELRERFGVDVKPEEIQMKVNQTRAKFRSVKKQLLSDPTSYPNRWKKYDIINRILKNLHRPKDAEPLPPGALLNNRDMTPPRENMTPQPQQQGLNLTTEATAATSFYNNSSNSNNSSSHNNNNSGGGGMSFNTELFTDQYDEAVKQEYEDDEYRSIPFQEPLQQYSPAEPAQLLELQTPQQIQQQQLQQQQQQPQFQPGYGQQFQQQQQPLQLPTEQQQQIQQPGSQPQQQQQPQPSVYTNSSSNGTAATINHQPITAVAYINSSNNTISVATNANGGTVGMSSPAPAPRRRGRPFGSSNTLAADSLEALYMEEVRRNTQLIAEQTKISRQRLELEERKLDLMQTFFPKVLENQTLILNRFMQWEARPQPTQQMHHHAQPDSGQPQQ